MSPRRLQPPWGLAHHHRKGDWYTMREDTQTAVVRPVPGPHTQAILQLLQDSPWNFHTLSSIADAIAQPPEYVRGLLRSMVLSRLITTEAIDLAIVYDIYDEPDAELLLLLDAEGPLTARGIEQSSSSTRDEVAAFLHR